MCPWQPSVPRWMIRSQLLRMARLFSELFHRAVEYEDKEDLLDVEDWDMSTLEMAEGGKCLH